MSVVLIAVLIVIPFVSGYNFNCSLSGHCEASIVVANEVTTNANNCLRSCKKTIDCEWFSFMPKSNLCEMLKGCQRLSEYNCPGCKSGQKECDYIRPKCLMVMGGKTVAMSSNVEIVGMDSNGSNCQDVPQLPHQLLFGGMSGLEFGVPIMCGGSSDVQLYESSCWKLSGGAWIHHSDMIEARVEASLVQVDGDTYIAMGGYNHGGVLKSTEMYSRTRNAWHPYVDLPFPVYRHCALLLNATTLMLIGGYSNAKLIAHTTFFHHINTNVWIQGPDLERGRYGHSCGKLTNMHENEDFKVTVLVVGGFGTSSIPLDSVEILDSDSWIPGPSLPKPLAHASMIENGVDGVVISGGLSYFANSKQLFQLDSNSSQWITLDDQELKTGRRSHTSVWLCED